MHSPIKVDHVTVGHQTFYADGSVEYYDHENQCTVSYEPCDINPYVKAELLEKGLVWKSAVEQETIERIREASAGMKWSKATDPDPPHHKAFNQYMRKGLTRWLKKNKVKDFSEVKTLEQVDDWEAEWDRLFDEYLATKEDGPLRLLRATAKLLKEGRSPIWSFVVDDGNRENFRRVWNSSKLSPDEKENLKRHGFEKFLEAKPVEKPCGMTEGEALKLLMNWRKVDGVVMPILPEVTDDNREIFRRAWESEHLSPGDRKILIEHGFEERLEEHMEEAKPNGGAAYDADTMAILHAAGFKDFDIKRMPKDRVQAILDVNRGPSVRIQSSAEFVAGYVPPDYMVDGLLQQGFLYSFTGSTGAGKTAVTLRLAASTALGVCFAGRETKKMRVLYLAAENPDDVRMRWIALSEDMGFDANNIDVFWVEGCFKISKMAKKLKAEAEKRGGEFGLVIIDTSPVFYEGDDENSRAQQGKHAEMLRGLITLVPGKPCVIANCHPVKNAALDNLLPAGGGNFINQMDGNLTASKNDGTTEVHTQGKFRGVEFAPMYFRIKTVTHPSLKDSKGKLVPTVICNWISEKEKEKQTTAAHKDQDAVLALVQSDPNLSQAEMAERLGWTLYRGDPNKMKVNRCLEALKEAKFIKKKRDRYVITEEGKKALELLPEGAM